MGISRRGTWFYWVKRIPKRYRGIVLDENGHPVQQVRKSLHTESRREAEALAVQLENEKMAEWEATLQGDTTTAHKHYENARRLSEARGYQYIPMADLISGDLEGLVDRVMSLSDEGTLAPPATVGAVLGNAPIALPGLLTALDEYFVFAAPRHLDKSEQQRTRWRNMRKRVIRHFLQVVGGTSDAAPVVDIGIDKITRADALKFRAWWAERVAAGMTANTANKEFGVLSEVFRTWAELSGHALENPFRKLAFPDKKESDKPAFTVAWVRDVILAPGALEALDDEAGDILLMMINTGLRPSEITDAPLDDFAVKANTPHLRVMPNGRELKQAHTKRDIPLLGVSLEAARRIVARGGIKRYAHRASAWSANINKFLRNNDLVESDRHTAYSLRHYCENALLAAGVDDRVRADIMGHKYNRPRYGDGGALEGRRDALEKIAL